MKRLFSMMPHFLALCFLFGCGHVEKFAQNIQDQLAPKEVAAAPERQPVFTADFFWQKALAYEKQKDLQRALAFARIAAELNPDNPELFEKVRYLQSEINRIAESYFAQGVTFFTNGNIESARQQFILALMVNPNHEGALDYVKDQLQDKEYREYRVRKNDTLRNVAEKFYQDPGKDFLIAYMNDLDINKPLVSGSKLKLVILDAALTRPPFDSKQAVEDARSFLNTKAYDDVLHVTEEILTHDASNREAKDLRSAAYYHQGLELSRKGKYDQAITTLNKVDPRYDGLAEAIQKVTDNELRNVRRLLENKQYTAAVDKVRHVMDHDPTNPDARELMNSAYCQMGKDYLFKKDYAKALTVLRQGDPAHECIRTATAEAMQSAKKQAEVHYLKGVKYFLNEQLAEAIEEWEMTLKLDPEYHKARESIQKAKEVLEKLRQVE